MKKIFIFLLLIALPVKTWAKINYEDSINFVNNYKEQLEDNDLYLMDGDVPFGYSDKLFISEKFKKSGFVNLSEFNTTKNNKGDTYLYDGGNYFTMTEDGEKVYEINISKNKYNLINKTDKSDIRSTHFIRSDVCVNGSGTYSDPWSFIKYRISLKLENALINGKSVYDGYTASTKLELDITPNDNYIFDPANYSCEGEADYNFSTNKLYFYNIKGDVSCTLKYKPDTYTANIIVNNGTTENNKLVINGLTSKTFTVVPTTNYSYTNSYCDNNQTITASGNNYTINDISSNTTCYINYLNIDVPYSPNTIEYEVAVSGDYYLEVYGAQGGNSGGKGGYAKGKVYLEKGNILYINTGGTDGTNGGGNKNGSTSYVGGGASTIKKGSSYLIIGAGGGATGTDGTAGGAGGDGSGAGGASVGAGAGLAGTNGGGGSSSPTYAKTCNGTCKTCSTCKYNYTGTCSRQVCASTSCNRCSYSGTCSRQVCASSSCNSCSYTGTCTRTTTCRRCNSCSYVNGKKVCEYYECDCQTETYSCTKSGKSCSNCGSTCSSYTTESYSCTKTGTNCSKCGSYCSSYTTESYSCTKSTTAANCNECGCSEYNTYDCSVLGKPGTGGKNSFGSEVISVTNSSGVRSGNGTVKITFIS
ncbi:MAG: hypothetical protein IJB83_06305 [Bacilli bacterium]|nr:hypothetical protein [Bacilli bacterium]